VLWRMRGCSEDGAGSGVCRGIGLLLPHHRLRVSGCLYLKQALLAISRLSHCRILGESYAPCMGRFSWTWTFHGPSVEVHRDDLRGVRVYGVYSFAILWGGGLSVLSPNFWGHFLETVLLLVYGSSIFQLLSTFAFWAFCFQSPRS